MAKIASAAAEPVEGPWALPRGWRWERLGTILPLSYGKALKATHRRGGDIPVYGSSGIAGFHDDALCWEPALIVGRKGSAGAVFHAAGPSYAIDTAYYCSATAARLDLRLAYHLLSFLNLRKLDQSTAVPSLSRDTYNDLVVPVPPESLQPVIAARIDELFAKIDDGEAALRRARDDLATWRKALLKAAVTGELTADWRAANPPAVSGADLVSRILAEHGARPGGKSHLDPEGLDASALHALPPSWAWTTCELAGDVKQGRQRAPAHHAGAHMRPYLRVANVMEGRLDLRDVKAMNFTPSEFEIYKLLPGDVLLNEGQSPELLGRPAIFSGEIAGACFQNTLLRFRPSPQVRSDFALVVFRRYMHAERFIRESRITTNLAHLTLGRFRTIEFPVPPMAEQAEIARRVSAAEASWDHEILSTPVAGTLRQSILAAAFRGELS